MTGDTRQSGRTTAQMLSAPQGAIYVWPVHRSLSYAKSLAGHLGRVDIGVAPAAWLTDNHAAFARSPVVVDHACHEMGLIGGREMATIDRLRDRGRLWEGS